MPSATELGSWAYDLQSRHPSILGGQQAMHVQELHPEFMLSCVHLFFVKYLVQLDSPRQQPHDASPALAMYTTAVQSLPQGHLHQTDSQSLCSTASILNHGSTAHHPFDTHTASLWCSICSQEGGAILSIPCLTDTRHDRSLQGSSTGHTLV